MTFRPLRFRNLWVVQNRSHVRGIVIDGRVGWTGGFGIDDKWLGDCRTAHAWRDTNVRFEGPAVRQLQAAFIAAWADATGDLLSGYAETDAHEQGVSAAGLAARSRYERLLGAGVRVFEYQPTTLHAKTFVVDGIWSSVGTMNFDNRSLALNDEDTLMVLDEDFARRMEELFRDDLRFAEEVELEQFRRRPRLARVAEWGADLMAPLL